MALVRKRIAQVDVGEVVQRTLEQVLLDLSNESIDQRRMAAVELGARREGADMLVERLHAELDRTVREAIVHALIAVGSPESARGVAPLLASDDATLRNQARELLHALPGAELEADRLLAEADPDVRMFALEVIATRLKAAGAERIMAALLTELDVNVCAHGAEQLGLFGSEAQLAPLAAVKRRFPDEDFLHFTIDQSSDLIRRRAAEPLTSSKHEN